MHFHILLAIKPLTNYSTNHRVFLFHEWQTTQIWGGLTPVAVVGPSPGRSITCIIRLEFRIQQLRIEAHDQEIHVRFPALAVITDYVAVCHSPYWCHFWGSALIAPPSKWYHSINIYSGHKLHRLSLQFTCFVKITFLLNLAGFGFVSSERFRRWSMLVRRGENFHWHHIAYNRNMHLFWRIKAICGRFACL